MAKNNEEEEFKPTRKQRAAKGQILSMGVNFLEMCKVISSSQKYWEAWQEFPREFLTTGYINEEDGVFWRGCGMSVPENTKIILRRDYLWPKLYVFSKVRQSTYSSNSPIGWEKGDGKIYTHCLPMRGFDKGYAFEECMKKVKIYDAELIHGEFPKLEDDEPKILLEDAGRWATYQIILENLGQEKVAFYLEMPDWVARYDQLFKVGTEDNTNAVILSCS